MRTPRQPSPAPRPRLIPTTLLLLALAGAAPQALAQGTPAPAGGASAATNTPAGTALKPCRVDGIPTEMLCGQLQRPLDPARPGGVQITVHYMVAPAMARNKLPDPVTLLAGGPGQSAISLAGMLMPRLSRLNNRRDIVFVDQRGTGQSAPLQCPEGNRLSMKEALDDTLQAKRLDECREQLQKLPYGDLRFFTTTLAMQDLDAVRAALGAPQWNLVGASYGTRAGLEYQRQFPQRVRRNIIDGVAPPDMVLPASFSGDAQAALDALLQACEQDKPCQARYPTLRRDWQSLLASLPRKVTLANPVTGEPETVELTRSALLRAVRAPLYNPSVAAGLPAALHAAAQGRFEGLGGLAGQIGGSRKQRLFTGMHFSVVCAEDMPRLAQSKDHPGSDFGLADRESYTRNCRDWPRGEVPADFYAIPPATAPVLVLSGGADPATPPRHGERVAQALGAKAVHVVVPQAGHGVMGLGCMRDVLFRFIDAATDEQALKLDTSCATRIPRPPAFLPPTLAATGSTQ